MIEVQKENRNKALSLKEPAGGTAFGYPRDFAGNRFVYAVISPRARGLSLGVNLCPNKHCNFDCVYCEVQRGNGATLELDVDIMAGELEAMLCATQSQQLRRKLHFPNVPDELLQLRHVTLSGDGEPTLCVQFNEVVQAIVHLRALGHVPFFKLVLLTNGTALDQIEVQKGLKFFTAQDEVWIKLDCGTQAYMNAVNKTDVQLDKVLSNILLVGRQRPVVIQSLFPLLNGKEPSPEEIDAYTVNLKKLLDEGTQIRLVQIYSATRPMSKPGCGHLPLRSLSQIAQAVRRVTGIHAEVF